MSASSSSASYEPYARSIPHPRAYSSALSCVRLATPRSSTFGDSFAPGITFRLMSAVDTIPHLTASATHDSSHVPTTDAYYRAMSEIGVGMLGYAFMGKAHSNAFRKIEY